MKCRTNNKVKKAKKNGGSSCGDIPIECIRRTRSLNIDSRSNVTSEEVYKILKSNNGRKIFT
jgi:hypothetical protein